MSIVPRRAGVWSAAIAGCLILRCGGELASRKYSSGVQVSDEYICQLSAGSTRLSDVKNVLGAPQLERQDGINKVLIYTYSETDGDELSVFLATSFRFDSSERLATVSRAGLEGDVVPNCDSL